MLLIYFVGPLYLSLSPNFQIQFGSRINEFPVFRYFLKNDIRRKEPKIF